MAKKLTKMMLISALVAALMIAAVGCGNSQEKEWKKSTDEQKLDTYFALIKESMLLEEDLGRNTPYIAMLRSSKGNVISAGMSKADALADAEYWIVLEQAVFWYADKHDISADDREVAEYINSHIEKAKQEQGFDQMEEACRKNNLTYSDTVWAYRNSYKWQYIMEKVSEEYKPELLESIIKDYKKTGEYKALLPVLKNCSALIEADETDIKTLKKADIYYPAKK